MSEVSAGRNGATLCERSLGEGTSDEIVLSEGGPDEK